MPLQTLRWRSRTEVFVERLDGVELPLVRIPAGVFLMGSPPDEPERSDDEGPQHQVQLTEFLMGQTPITQAQWRAVMDNNPSQFADQPDSDQRPVEHVSWSDAMAFCQRLSERTGRYYTMPSEAQWEYACRAGTSTAFHFGGTLTTELANHKGGQTTPVRMFPANAWGLHDMHGNVWEWCLDHWHGNYEGAPTDGSAWLNTQDTNTGPATKGGNSAPSRNTKGLRLLRGGSWNDLPRDCRSAYRGDDEPGSASVDFGFRVVCLPQDPSLNT